MQRLTNTVKDYPWGAPSGIPEILGTVPDGRPAAELWVGAHPSAPSCADGRRLDALIDEDPVRHLGQASVDRFGSRLPFLLKVLSARTALSIQSHPSRQEAIDGYAAEDAAGIPVDAPHRSYRDEWHKPELLYALGDFHALCGFRCPSAVLATLDRLAAALDATAGQDPKAPAHRESLAVWRAALQQGTPEEGLRDAVALVLGDASRFGALADACARAAADPSVPRVGEEHPSHEGSSVDPLDTLVQTHADFPHDPGALVALMLRRYLLRAGESLALDTGILHAYLEGMGVEIMASSDNVLRGGLTGKHIDVPELLRTVRFDTAARRVRTCDGSAELRGATDDFALTVLRTASDRTVSRPGALTALCTEGAFTVRAGAEELVLHRGQSLFIGADEPRPVVSGEGALFLASTALST